MSLPQDEIAGGRGSHSELPRSPHPARPVPAPSRELETFGKERECGGRRHHPSLSPHISPAPGWIRPTPGHMVTGGEVGRPGLRRPCSSGGGAPLAPLPCSRPLPPPPPTPPPCGRRENNKPSKRPNRQCKGSSKGAAPHAQRAPASRPPRAV